MFYGIDTSTLLIAITVVAAFSFFFGSVLDAIAQANGFGPTGNTLLVLIGFAAGTYTSSLYGFHGSDMKVLAACGLAGAFVLFITLALIKAGLSRR